ncbi:MAG: hypothetical protein FJZ01_16410 [Candidatus Sericytochromatia bacterium]|nr:hypothetical protein [Candidatus Tanganyikabacteria bacterium]
MQRVDDSARPVPRRKAAGAGAGAADSPRLAGDSLAVRDGAALQWFWQKLQELRLKLAAIEARFGLLPAPAPKDGEPEFVRTKVDGFRDIMTAPKPAAVVEPHLTTSGLRLQVANRLTDENKAVARLSLQDRAAYDKVRDLVETDAEGRHALQTLLLSGRLAGQTAADGRSALFHLGLMTTGDLGEGVDRKKLVGQLLEELENPAKLYQGSNNTCVPAVMAIMLARRQPGELIRIVGGLAAKEGVVRLADGAEIGRTADWQAPDGGRSVGQALFQPALIALALAPEGLTYSNRTDRISDGGNGLSVEEADVALSSLTGRNWASVDFYTSRDPGRIDEVIGRIADLARRGQPVPVGLNWTAARNGHKILVDKIENDRVYYYNPYGTRESMSLFELKKRITNVNLPG